MAAPSRLLLLLTASILTLTVACESKDDRPASSDDVPHGAVLIVLDTVRADHLSCYGHDRRTSPNIDKLAKSGVRFAQVVSPSPWTLPSMGALLTGEYPERGPARTGRLSSSIVELLRHAGMTTAAFTEGGYVSREFGMDLGFTHFVEEEGAVQRLKPGERPDPYPRGGIERTFRLAREWLIEHKGERFFLLIHTYEAHTPYTRRDFARGLDAGRVGPTLDIPFLRPLQTGEIELNEAEIQYVSALYDGGILYADRHVGSFLSFLEATGLKDKTLVVVTSDHGEELGDHYPGNTADHGHSLRDPLLLVPLVVFNPLNHYAVRTVSAQVRLLDVMPTIADLLGVSIERTLDGESLVATMTGTDTADRLALAAHTKKGPRRVCIRTGGFKYIVAKGKDTSRPMLRPPPARRQLYDLNSDPLERRNMIDDKPTLARAMAKALTAAYATFGDATGFQPPDVADGELMERLKSLGYIGD